MSKKKQIVQLHNHMMNSFLDGVGSPKEWIERCVELNIPGLALTDHGNCCGLLDFYREAYKTDSDGNRLYGNFTPILGCEFYICTNLVNEDPKNRQPSYHITVMAKNEEGYKNLLKLASEGYKYFYRKARIDINMLFKYKKGLIVTTGCLGSFWGQCLMEGHYDKALMLAKMFKKNFGDDFYAEIMPILVDCDWDKTKPGFVPLGFNKQARVNQGIMQIAQKLNIKMIPTLDAHYPKKEDKVVQDVLILNSFVSKGMNGWHFSTDTHYLQDVDETWEYFKKWHPSINKKLFDEMVDNSYEVLNKCKDLRLNLYEFDMPKYPYEDHRLYSDGDDAISLCKKIIKFYSKIDLAQLEYKHRLMAEMSLINKYNFLDYFLILEDIVYWSKQNGVFVGPSRGSAGGSLLAFAMDITQVDPIRFGCQFERFLNEDRLKGDKNAIPDIDMDFSDSDKVKKYIVSKFGVENVAAISTAQRMSVKQAIKDAARVILPRSDKEFDYWDISKITDKLPAPNAQIGDHKKFYDCLKGDHEKTDKDKAYPDPHEGLIEFLDSHKDTDLDKVVGKLVGKNRQLGVHPCAIVIADTPLTDFVPTMYHSKNETWVTQYTMGDVEASGLVKFDILSLNTLNYIASCVELIKDRHGVSIKTEDIPLDDEEIFKAFTAGDTATVFQFNTEGMQAMLKAGGVEKFTDLPAYNSLYRPGPLDMGMDKTFIDRKHGKEEVEYLHPMLEPILKDTLGIIIYQEQITEIVHKLGGFTRAEADIVRRMVSKSRGEELVQFEAQFLEHATTKIEPCLQLHQASDLWKQVLSFGGYGFNKSHAVGYSLVGYWCQYLKTHYPLEWWASVLKFTKLEEVKTIYKQNERDIDLPDVNSSKETFFIAPSNKIVMPIGMVHGVGSKATEEIIKNQPYLDFNDFIKKVRLRVVNKGVITNLIFANCFRNLSIPDGDSSKIEDVLNHYYTNVRKEEIPSEYKHLDRSKLLLLNQKSLPVIFYNYHEYFDEFFKDARDLKYVSDKAQAGWDVKTGGQISRIYKFVNRRGDRQAFITLSNEDDELTVVAFSDSLEKYESDLEEGKFVLTSGRVSVYNDKKNLILSSLEVLAI